MPGWYDRPSVFLQALANRYQQLSDSHTVLKALTFRQPPVVLPYRPLITVHERCSDSAPEGQLPPDCAQFFLCSIQKLHS